MNELPATAFGRTLRRLIRQEFGSQTRFAKELGTTKSWVSKLIRGSQESLSYASLERIAGVFPRPAQQTELYEAWAASYACSPSSIAAPNRLSTEAELVVYAEAVHTQIAAGNVLKVYQELRSLWQVLSHGQEGSRATFEVGCALVHAANQLDRYFVSLQVLDGLQASCRLGEPFRLATVLWLRGVTLRLVRPRQLSRAERALRDFDSYLSSWNPELAPARQLKGQLMLASARDLALSALDLGKARPSDSRLTLSRLLRLESYAQAPPASTDFQVESEVMARGLIALGHYDQANVWLERSSLAASTPTTQVKVRISKIQLNLATADHGDLDEQIEQALDLADKFTLVHQRHKLLSIQANRHRTDRARIVL